MHRGAIGPATVILAIVVVANPVSAKGIAWAHFSGPGLPADGVILIRAGGIQRTGLVAPKRDSLSALGVAREDLGTAYRARYRMDYAPQHTLRQLVYPYAVGGPITFTPRGQHIGQDYESFRGGWYAAGPGLLRLLVAHGIPRHDPTNADEVMSDRDGNQDLEAAGSTIQKSAPGLQWSIAVGGLILLVLVARTATRVRRSRE